MAAPVCNVVIYGDSLILEGVRACLSGCAGIRLLQFPCDPPAALETMRDWCPAIFILDLNAVAPDFQVALLRQPGLVLVGVDSETHRAWVWSGWQATAADAVDLLGVVQKVSETLANIQPT